MDSPSTESKTESKGKSWRREREERGRRPQPRDVEDVQTGDTKSTDGGNQNSNYSGSSYNKHWSKGNKKKDINRSQADSTTTNTEKTMEVEKIPDASPVEKSFENVSTEKVSEDDVHAETDDKAFLEAYVIELTDRLKQKTELRIANINAPGSRPEESFFSRLDSTLKKNTTFVKKLKTISEAQRDSLMKDMTNLNLSKYISEAAASIVEAKLKMSDVSTAVHICSALHQRYADFSTQLLENWQKVLPLKKDDKITNLSKIRVDLRFFAELITCGVFTLKEGLPVLKNLLSFLMSGDKEEHHNLNILLSFCKHCGEDYAGLVPRRVRQLAERYGKDLPSSDLLPIEKQKGVQALFKDYYKSLCKHLLKDHKNLQSLERQNRRILQTKGELSSEQKEKYETASLAFQKLFQNAQQFADILDEDVPDLPKEESTASDAEGATLDIHNRYKDGEMDGTTTLWEDDDTRSFYENLPDLKAFIPGILFKDNTTQSSTTSQTPESPEPVLEEDMSKLEIEELMDVNEEDKEGKVDSGKNEEKDLTETLLQEIDAPEEEPGVSSSATNKLLLEGFTSSLLNCVNREMVDLAAEHFIMNLNTKPNRKKLVKTLFLVPRTRLDLLPFYARFVATLYPCMSDIANELVTMLKQDFKFHIKKKDQINIESKVKTVRFIGELVKFKIFPKSEALYCLKMLLFDFTHHHIEMACNLLETCGRFLFRSPDSHQRTKVYLEQMMRKKAVQALDSRYTTMIENAFYYCNPPETQATVKVKRPPIHDYIRKLLYKDLTKNNTEKILRQMRKLDWENPDISAYATKCLTAIWNVKYYNIRCVANLLAGLVAYQETVGPQVVDGVLEDIRLGMEVNHPKYNQHRVSTVHYLGELYNYRMVESSVIFRVLYSFITFGINYDGTPSDLDPPDNLFRIRLVSILLETCGQYFNTGSSKKKLDCFIVFFQKYFWQKRCTGLFNDDYPFPVTVKFLVKDVLTSLRPKIKLCESLDESVQVVQNLMSEFKPKIEEFCPNISLPTMDDENVSETSKEDDALGSIQEVEEDDGDENRSCEVSDDQDLEGDGDTDVYSGSQSQPMDDDNDDDDDDDGDDIEGLGLTSEDECTHSIEDGQDVAIVPGGPKHIPCQEDEDFMTAFDKMLSESILHRSQDVVKPQVDIVIPLNLKGGAQKKTYGNFRGNKQEEEKITMNFILMTRRGNKPQFKSLEVPVSSELAQNLKDREEAERAEKEQVKLLTLNINERQEEEDYQEMLAAQQRPAVLNLNRDRRHKYQHPKGAPDADLIFGNKKR